MSVSVVAHAKRVVDAPLTTWILLALPAPALLADIGVNERYYAELMYESGLPAVQLMILALAITPAMWLTKNWPRVHGIVRWLGKRRRYIGLAAFGYAALHTFFYIREIGSLDLVILELSEIELTTGWLAFVILLALALTSNDFSVRWMGKRWKRLQRGAYLAAAITALHWFLFDQFLNEMLWWFGLIALLQIARVLIQRLGSRRTAVAR